MFCKKQIPLLDSLRVAQIMSLMAVPAYTLTKATLCGLFLKETTSISYNWFLQRFHPSENSGRKVLQLRDTQLATLKDAIFLLGLEIQKN